MTELQKQVTLIRKSHAAISSGVLLSDGKPSIFLTPSEAAGIDVQTVYEAATTGLDTLSQYDDRCVRISNIPSIISSLILVTLPFYKSDFRDFD